MNPSVYLVGGLGNQLWIGLFVHHLLHRYNSVDVDISWYQPYSRFFFNPSRTQRLFQHDLLRRTLPRARFSSRFSLLILYRLSTLSLLRGALQKHLCFHSGYFQYPDMITDQYLMALRDSLYSIVNERYSSSISSILFGSYDSIHIRVGDRGSVTLDTLHQYLDKLLPILSPTVYILSDDTSIAIQAFDYLDEKLECKLVLPEHSCELLDFFILSRSGTVFAFRESTFSFWAQQLTRLNTPHPK